MGPLGGPLGVTTGQVPGEGLGVLGTDEEPGRGPTPAPFILFMTSDPCPITTSTVRSAVTCHCECDEEMPCARGSWCPNSRAVSVSPKQGGSPRTSFSGGPAFLSRGGRGPHFPLRPFLRAVLANVGCLRGKARKFSFLLQTAG